MSEPNNLDIFRRLAGQQLVDAILAYEEFVLRRGEPARAEEAPWYVPGAVENIIDADGGFILECAGCWVRLSWLGPDCVHVRAGESAKAFDKHFSYAVHKTSWASAELDVTEDNNTLIVRAGQFTYRIGKSPFRLSAETVDGRVIWLDSAGLEMRADGARLTLKMQPQETGYGLGERAYGLNLRGRRYALWNTDPPDYRRGDDPLYYCVPFYLGVHSDGVYGVFWDNSSRGYVDVGRDDPSLLTFASETGTVDYYLFAGEDVNAVLSRYTELTGRMPLPPVWFLGYQQCRFSYDSRDAIMALADNFRSRHIPCDVVYLDIHYMDGFRVFTVDDMRFPDFQQMIESLHRQGFKVVAVIDPGIKIDSEYMAYRSGIERRIFLKYADGTLVAAPVWPGDCHFPDFTQERARLWWAEQCQILLASGIDGLWNDMCEPTVFRNQPLGTLFDDVLHDKDGLGGNHLENHNIYGMQMARATQQALIEHNVDKRPVNIVRAGYAGTQRYASTWTGDNSSTWDHLRLSISMTLNLGLSGAPLAGPDVGGYFGNAEPELVTRWTQAAALMPYFRNHTVLDTAPQEPWAFGQPYETFNRRAIELRYRLMPYLYSVVALSAEYGWPIIRPLFMAEPHNRALRTVDDCYLLGDGLLVAPVVERGASRRRVYLPHGSDWYNFWTHERYEGGEEIVVDAPLDRLPLFARSGLVLPMWPVMQYMGENPVERLVLRVFPGNHETTLYEDEGEGPAYQNGVYRWVYITAHEEDDDIILNRRTAGNYEPPYQTTSLEVVGLTEEPLKVRVDRQGAPLWFFDDGLLEITVDSFRDVVITRKSSSSDPTLPKRPW